MKYQLWRVRLGHRDVYVVAVEGESLDKIETAGRRAYEQRDWRDGTKAYFSGIEIVSDPVEVVVSGY